MVEDMVLVPSDEVSQALRCLASSISLKNTTKVLTGLGHQTSVFPNILIYLGTYTYSKLLLGIYC